MIKSKAEFYAEQRAHRCGNFYAQHLTYDALVSSGYTGLVSVRDVTKGGRAESTREMHRTPVNKIPKALRRKDAGVAFFPTPRDNHITFQGEFSLNGGLGELRYSHVKLPMLYAFKKQDLRATGVTARWLLRKYLDAPSLETVYELIDKHTDHSNVFTPVIEFTSYDVAVGTEGRNTVIWECRSY